MTTAVILAGGLGTRLRATVPNAPKPMALINGRPFLEHQLDYWIKQGITRAILSVGYMHDAITSHFKNSYKGIPIDYAVEETPLGTGGGLLLALAKLHDDKPFLVLNGDTFVECTLPAIQQSHTRNKADWTMVVFKADKPDRYGEMTLATDGRFTELRTEKAVPGAWANAGVYLISPNALQSLPFKAGDKVSLEQDLLAAVLAKGSRCFTSSFNGVFIDIGMPDDYVAAAKLPAFQ
jgi:D-glycero-alpha-D-manno-heptose 1-phosphate guanylyltransferase